MHPILEAKNLIKEFGSFKAVNGISFTLKEGEILGLLGPNGAGKTTTIQMLLGALSPTSGEVLYFGKDLSHHREEILEQVNFSSTYTNLPWDLTVRECLSFISFLYDIKDRKGRIAKLVELFDLKALFNKKINQLSAGQITRVNVAKAFINFPKVLLLDEPTASLDPDVADYIRRFLLEERKNFQTSIIFTSHNMAEVEEVCDRVIFINQGKVVANNTPKELSKTLESCHIEFLPAGEMFEFENYCKQNNLGYKISGKNIVIDVKEKNLAGFLQELNKAGLVYDEISIEKPSLEDFFLEQTKKGKI